MNRKLKDVMVEPKDVEVLWMTQSAAQKYLGVGRRFFENCRLDGRLHWYKVGKMIFYRKREIDRLIEGCRIF